MYKFNRYSWLLSILFLITSLRMTFKSQSDSLKGIMITAPLIILLIIWSEIKFPKGKKIISSNYYNWDFFILTYTFAIGGLLTLILQFRISEFMDLWPLYLYFITILGIAFAFVYSLVALPLNRHKRYTFFYSAILIFFFLLFSLLNNLFPKQPNELLFYISLVSLLGIHMVFILYKYTKGHISE